MLSWCVVNGGFQRTQTAAWLYLEQNEIAGVTDHSEWIRARVHAEGFPDAVGFLTSRRVHKWVEADAAEAELQAWAIGTVGLSNLLRAGDPTVAPLPSGTINILVYLSAPLTMEAA